MLAVDSVVQGTAELLVAGRGPADRSFSRAVIDSRRVERGDLFFALHGERRDGHDFIGEALERGGGGEGSGRAGGGATFGGPAGRGRVPGKRRALRPSAAGPLLARPPRRPRNGRHGQSRQNDPK